MNLPRRQGCVWRDVDSAGGQDGHVGDEPLDAVFRHQAHTVARLDALGHQGRGHGFGLLAVLLPGYVKPQAMALEAQRRTGSKTLRLTAMELGEIALAHRPAPFTRPRTVSNKHYPVNPAPSRSNGRRNALPVGKRQVLSTRLMIYFGEHLCCMPQHLDYI